MFNPDSMARFRSLADNSLSETCTIEKESDSQGVYGERLHNWDMVASGVNCRVLPGGEGNTSEAGLSGDRETLTEEYRLVLAYGTELGADYRVTVNSVVYHVVRVEQALTDDVFTQAFMVRDNG